MAGKLKELMDQLAEQPAFVQLKAKWDEQDYRTRSALKYGSVIGGGLLLFGTVFVNFRAVESKREEIAEKLAMVKKIQTTQEKLRQYRSNTSSPGLTSGGEWAPYIQEIAGSVGLSGETLNVTESKAPAPKTTSSVTPEESLIQVDLKKVNIKQLVKFVTRIENGVRTAKIRSMLVDTQPDESGYLDARVAISGFTVTRNP